MKTFPHSGAFPCSATPDTAPAQGLSKLEYFTAAALTGLLAAEDGGSSYESTARAAVKQARAVIAALNAEAEA